MASKKRKVTRKTRLEVTPQLVGLCSELADRVTTAVESQGYGPEGALAVAAMLIGGYLHGQGEPASVYPAISELVEHFNEYAAHGKALRLAQAKGLS